MELHGITWLVESGRVAKLIRRQSDLKVTRVLLLALPNELAHRSPQSTVQEVSPMLWIERVNLHLFRV